MSEYSDETLDRDLRDLAQALLDHPEFGPIIRDVGIGQDFTDEQLGKILAFCDTAACFDPVVLPNIRDHYNYSSPNYFDNRWLAIAVARRVGQGDFISVDSAAAHRMIIENKVPLDKSELKTYRKRKVAISDFVPLFLEFAKTPSLEKAFADFLPVYEIYGGSNWDHSDVKDVILPIEIAARNAMRRYGFMQQYISMAAIWREMKLADTDTFNKDEIYSEASRWTDYVDMGA